MLRQVIQIAQSLRQRGRAALPRVPSALLDDALQGSSRSIVRVLHQCAARQSYPGVTAAAAALTVLELVVWCVGFCMGGSVAGALLVYSGTRPVNVLPILGFFAILPLLLSVLFLVATLTRAWWPRLVILGDLAEVLALGRSRLAGWVSRWSLPSELKGLDVSRWSGLMGWLAARWSLGLGVAFQIGGMGLLVLSVLFSDLAFGWATTLELDSQAIVDVFAWVAAPWSWAWPAATVDIGLVEASRVYREPGDLTGVSVEGQVLGRWWPFLLMTMLVYGLFPRLLVFGLALWGGRHESVRVIVGLEGVRDVLLDLKEGPVAPSSEDGQEVQAELVAGGVRLDPNPVAIFAVAGLMGRSDEGKVVPLSESRLVAENLRADAGDVQVRVRGWEPPVGDVLDDLRALRRSLDESLRVVVVLEPLEGRRVEALNSADWRRAVRALGERGMVVAVAGGDVDE